LGVLLAYPAIQELSKYSLKGYDGMKAHERTISPREVYCIPEALDRLIAPYTALEKPDEVKKSKALRAQYSTIQRGGKKPQ
jgi:hypothetical protein